jgi:hypothetical protein
MVNMSEWAMRDVADMGWFQYWRTRVVMPWEGRKRICVYVCMRLAHRKCGGSSTGGRNAARSLNAQLKPTNPKAYAVPVVVKAMHTNNPAPLTRTHTHTFERLVDQLY